MNIKEKKAEILKALESGEVSQRNIDTTKGRNAKKLRQGILLREDTINRMYQALINIRKNTNPKERKIKARKTVPSQQQKEQQTRSLKNQLIPPSLTSRLHSPIFLHLL